MLDKELITNTNKKKPLISQWFFYFINDYDHHDYHDYDFLQ